MPPLPLRERGGSRNISSAPVRVRGTEILLRCILAVISLLLLSAWAPRPAHLHIRSIGIIAAVGDTCMFAHVTDGTFEEIGPPDADFLEISDWGIDDEVARTIAAALAPRYSVQPITVVHQEFDTWTYELLARHVHELPLPDTAVDAYLLILRDWQADSIGGSDHQLGGLGMYRRDLPHGGKRVAVFASYTLVLAEPRRGAIIASRPATLPDGRFPSLPASSSLWPRTANNLSDKQRGKLRADFLLLIGKSVPGTLRQLGLATK